MISKVLKVILGGRRTVPEQLWRKQFPPQNFPASKQVCKWVSIFSHSKSQKVASHALFFRNLLEGMFLQNEEKTQKVLLAKKQGILQKKAAKRTSE